jgi:hypothetical protein
MSTANLLISLHDLFVYMQKGPVIPMPVAVWFLFIIHSVVSYDRSITSSRVSSPQEC